MAFSFKDKIALVTGGSSGIGLALVKTLLARGARVATCSRHLANLNALAAQVGPDRLFIQVADVGTEGGCRTFVQSAIQHFGGADILINNAGMSMRALFSDMEDTSVLHKLMDVNFWGAVHCTHYALPALLKSGGTVVGVSSIAGYRGLPGRTGYSASKFAMQGFLESLRTENLHTGLKVMWVCPGFTASNIRNTALDTKGQAQKETPLDEAKLMSAEAVAEAILNAIAFARRTLVLTTQGKLTVWLNKLFPALADKIVYNHFKKEPGSPLR